MRKQAERKARQKARFRAKVINWSAVILIGGLLVYGISQMSNIAYDEDAIGVVNFSALDSDQKQTALEAANSARCTCGCGMHLAQCVATDMTCPIRDGNIERIKTMVREAMATPSS
jgi:hypothetical protein